MKTVRVNLKDDLHEWAADLARERELDSENNPGVASIMKTALKTYLKKYHPDWKKGENGVGEG